MKNIKTINFPDFHPFSADIKKDWHLNNFQNKLSKLAKKHNVIFENYLYPNCNNNYEFTIKGDEGNLKQFYAEFMEVDINNIETHILKEKNTYGGFYEEDYQNK